MTELGVRAFDPSDTDEVVAVWQACDLVRPWNDPRLDIVRKLAVDPGLFLVAVRSGHVVGTVMAGYEGHRGWLNYLAVHPRHRGHGYARQLVGAAEVRLAELGCPKINLQVRAENDAVIGFYRHLGYRVDDVTSMGKRLVRDGPPAEPNDPARTIPASEAGATAVIGLALAAWSDLDRLLAQVPDDLATVQPGPGRASVAWTVGHLANQVDGWLNVRFVGAAPHARLSADEWRMGGDGSASDWPAVRDAALAVRAIALRFLTAERRPGVDRRITYPGQMAALAGRDITLAYALARVASHTYFHIGALAADLVAAGRSVGDYPGTMLAALATDD